MKKYMLPLFIVIFFLLTGAFLNGNQESVVKALASFGDANVSLDVSQVLTEAIEFKATDGVLNELKTILGKNTAVKAERLIPLLKWIKDQNITDEDVLDGAGDCVQACLDSDSFVISFIPKSSELRDAFIEVAVYLVNKSVLLDSEIFKKTIAMKTYLTRQHLLAYIILLKAQKPTDKGEVKKEAKKYLAGVDEKNVWYTEIAKILRALLVEEVVVSEEDLLLKELELAFAGKTGDVKPVLGKAIAFKDNLKVLAKIATILGKNTSIVAEKQILLLKWVKDQNIKDSGVLDAAGTCAFECLVSDPYVCSFIPSSEASIDYFIEVAVDLIGQDKLKDAAIFTKTKSSTFMTRQKLLAYAVLLKAKKPTDKEELIKDADAYLGANIVKLNGKDYKYIADIVKKELAKLIAKAPVEVKVVPVKEPVKEDKKEQEKEPVKAVSKEEVAAFIEEIKETELQDLQALKKIIQKMNNEKGFRTQGVIVTFANKLRWVYRSGRFYLDGSGKPNLQKAENEELKALIDYLLNPENINEDDAKNPKLAAACNFIRACLTSSSDGYVKLSGEFTKAKIAFISAIEKSE